MIKSFLWSACPERQNIKELIASLSILLIGVIVPDAVGNALVDFSSPDIPYQQVGDYVVLDLQHNHELVDVETVTNTMLFILTYLLTLVVLLLSSLMVNRNESRDFLKMDTSCILCVFMVGMGFTVLFTNTLKIYCRRLRPNFYDYCGFDADSLSCQGDPDDVQDSQKSFPSGHSSMSFSSMMVLTLYFLGLANRQEQNMHKSLKQKLLCMASCVPMCVAGFVAASRVHDNYHFPVDVVAGALLGSGCSYFSFRLWYPSVFSTTAGYPLQQQQQESTATSSPVMLEDATHVALETNEDNANNNTSVNSSEEYIQFS